MRRKGIVVKQEAWQTTNTLRTAVEIYKDGHREVYHQRINDNNEGWAWTHSDTPETRAECSACTRGTLDSVRGAK